MTINELKKAVQDNEKVLRFFTELDGLFEFDGEEDVFERIKDLYWSAMDSY